MTQTAVIVVGEAVADITLDGPAAGGGGLAMTGHAGGSPANVAVGLARLGVRSRFAGRLSGEGLGPFLRAHLTDSGVDLGLSVDAPQPATAAIVGVDEAGGASYSFYVQGTADWQWEPSELPRVEPGAAIHAGSLAIALAPGGQVVADWIAAQRARSDAFVSLDPNIRPALVLDLPGYRERLDATHRSGPSRQGQRRGPARPAPRPRPARDRERVGVAAARSWSWSPTAPRARPR